MLNFNGVELKILNVNINCILKNLNFYKLLNNLNQTFTIN